MKKINRIIILIAVIFFCFTSFASAGWFSKSHSEKAQEFIKARMFDKAIGELEKEIDEHPTNAEAHYQLGIIYIHKQSYGRAEERFNSAFSLNPQYGVKIARVFKQSGDMYLSRTFITRAINNYRQALRYNPSLRDNILEKCFQKIIFLLDPAKRLSSPAENLAAFIRENTSAFNEKIKKTEQDYARKCLQIAKSRPRNQRHPYLKEAKKYLDQKEINKIIPPPTWKTVWGPKEFVGKGMGKNDYIYTAELGKDVKYGDRLIFLGKEFETWRNGGFKKFFNRHIVINRNSGVGGKFLIKAPKNQKVIVKVERLM